MKNMKLLVKGKLSTFIVIGFVLFVTRLAYDHFYVHESSLDQINAKSAGSSYFEIKLEQVAKAL